MATPKQLAANKANAQKSTGPKTPAGKAVAKMNAVKHGLLARHVVLQGQHDGERVHEFRQLHERYWKHYAPVGPVEEMLVERIVTTYWRLHRVLIAEGGEIARSVDSAGEPDSEPTNAQLLLAAMNGMYTRRTWEVNYMMHVLQTTYRSVEKDSELTEATLQQVVKAFMGQPNHVTSTLQGFRDQLLANSTGLSAETLQAEHRQLVLAYLNKELEYYDRKLPALREREEHETKSRRAAAHLPTFDTLDKILRYETTLERQLYRAMNQLERLQRMRQGEVVPAPLTVDVSGNGAAHEK